MIPKPVYYDLWGYPVDWTDQTDGWDEYERREFIKLTNRIIAQSTAQENYTEIGYMKMKIPMQLYEDIMKQRSVNNLRYEDCNIGLHNCYEYFFSHTSLIDLHC